MLIERSRHYRPEELVELSDWEIERMIRRGQDPAHGLAPYRVGEIIEHAIKKLRRRPGALYALARAVEAERELARAEYAARALAPDYEAHSNPASAQLY